MKKKEILRIEQLQKENELLRRKIAEMNHAVTQANQETSIQENSAELCENLLQIFNGGVYICAKDYKLKYLNNNLSLQTGYYGENGICYKVLYKRQAPCEWCQIHLAFKGHIQHSEFINPNNNRWYKMITFPYAIKNEDKLAQIYLEDITDIKKLQLEITKIQKIYDITINSLTDSIYLVDKELNIVLVNHAFIEMAEKIKLPRLKTGTKLTDYFKFIPKKILEEYEYVFTTGEKLITYDHNIVENVEIYTKSVKTPILNNGITEKILVTITETTQQEIALLNLKANEGKFRSIFDDSIVPMLFINWRNNYVCDCNRAAIDFLGYSKEELCQYKLSEIIYQNKNAELTTNSDKINKDTNTEIIQIRKKDGNIAFIKLNITRINSNLTDNQQIAVIVDYTDIINKENQIIKQTENLNYKNQQLETINNLLIKNEEELKIKNKRLELFKLFIETASDSILWLDYSGNILYANQAFVKLSGYDVAEINSKNIAAIDDFIFSDLWKVYREKLREKQFITFESFYKTKSGRKIPVEVIVNEVLYNEIKHFLVYTRDISSKKQVHEALQISEERFRLMADILQDGITIIENETIIYYNQRLTQILNIDISHNPDIYIKPFLFPTKESININTVSQEIEFNQQNKRIESWINLSNGQRKYIQNKYSSMKQNNKQYHYIITTDFTERKLAEIALDSNVKLFKSLVESLTAGVLIYQGLKLKYMNAAAEKITGYSKESIANMDFYEIVHPDFWNIIDNLNANQNQNNPFFSTEVKIKTKNKQDKWIDIRSSTIAYEGQLGGLFTFFDITSRKIAESKLLESELQYRTLFEASPLGIFHYNQRGFIVAYNPKVKEILGLNHNHIINHHFEEIFSNTAITQALSSALYDEKPIYEGLISDQSDTTIRLIANSMRSANNTFIGAIAIIEDITEKARAQQQLLEKNAELEHLLYVTSHDLRSPLLNIQGFTKEIEQIIKCIDDNIILFPQLTDLLKQHNTESIENTYNAFRFIYTSTDKMNKLLSGLLKMSRINKLSIKKQVVNTNNIIHEIIASFEYQIKKGNINIRYSDLPDCTGDEILIYQIFLSLIDNAIKYLDKSKEGIIKISGTIDKTTIIYCIEDNGIGISNNYQQKIFDIFQKLNQDKAGEGIGLSIIKKMLEKMNGKIWLSSTIGLGSKFYFSLPK